MFLNVRFRYFHQGLYNRLSKEENTLRNPDCELITLFFSTKLFILVFSFAVKSLPIQLSKVMGR